MRSSVSSKLLLFLPSNVLCFVVLSPSWLGASTWWAAWPRFPLGLIHRFNLSAYSSVLCLLAHRTFPRGNALPVGYLARRASTRIGLQPIRSGDYPATPTPPFQGGE